MLQIMDDAGRKRIIRKTKAIFNKNSTCATRLVQPARNSEPKETKHEMIQITDSTQQQAKVYIVYWNSYAV